MDIEYLLNSPGTKEIADAIKALPNATQAAADNANAAAANANDAAAEARSAAGVRYDESQTLTDTQKATARSNIDAADQNEVADIKSAITDLNQSLYGVNVFDNASTIARYSDQYFSYSDGKFAVKGRSASVGNVAIIYFPVTEETKYLVSISGKNAASTGVNIYIGGYNEEPDAYSDTFDETYYQPAVSDGSIDFNGDFTAGAGIQYAGIRIIVAATQTDPFVGLLTAVVAENTGDVQKLTSDVQKLTSDVEGLSSDVEGLSSDVDDISNIVITSLQIGNFDIETKREEGGTTYKNFYFSQPFVSGKKYKIIIDLTESNFTSGWVATATGTGTSAPIIDGGNVAGWIFSNEVEGVLEIQFTATDNASVLRIRVIYADYNQNTFNIKVYQDGISRVDYAIEAVNAMKPMYTSANANKLTTVYEINRARDCFNLAFLTDTHCESFSSGETFNILNQINKSQVADMIVHGGDFISGAYNGVNGYVAALLDTRSSLYIPNDMCMVKGNHENDTAYNLSNAQIALMFQNNVGNKVINENEPNGAYFYKDYPLYKIRVICLNSWHDSAGGTTTPSFGELQETWLYNTALNVPDGYAVLCIAHSIHGSGDANAAYVNVQNILYAFNDKGNTHGGYSFDANAPGTLIGCITGHMHNDSYSSGAGFNRITVTRAGASNSDGYAVDIFTVDIANETIYETRFGGRGEDRAFTFGSKNNAQILP